MTVLIYENRKTEPIIIDASTEEAELAAFMALFEYLKEEWQVYSGLESVGDKPQLHIRAQSAMYQKAMGGCANSARKLLSARRSYEYEGFQLINVINPLEPDQLPLR